MDRKDFIPPEIDERLREWAAYFKDRPTYTRIYSAEARYQRHSDDLGEEVGVQAEYEPPKTPKPRGWILRALETEDALRNLPVVQRWVLTYAFCYPALPRFVVLRALRKFTGRRLNWRQFTDQLDIGRLRLHTFLFGQSNKKVLQISLQCRISA